MTATQAPTPGPLSGHVYVEVSGLTGTGKSAVMGEIKIALKALGLPVEHGPDFQAEKNGTHADWQEALDLYKPVVVLRERNVSRLAPTPGPLDSESVKLLVKGDLLRIDTGGALYRFLRTKASPSSLVIAEPIGGGLEGYYDRCRFAFIGRPDADGWITHDGGENPVGDAVVEVKCRDGSTGIDTGSIWQWDSEYAPIIAFRLAPTAPVEASGSERDWSDAEVEAAAQALVNHRWNGTQPGFDRKPPSWKAEHVAEVKAILAALRPQPSGETRELLGRATAIADDVERGNVERRERAIWNDRIDRIVAALKSTAAKEGREA